MVDNTELTEALALELLRCETVRQARGPLSADEWPSLTVADAYRIQDASRRHRESKGERVIGVKMGLTSRAKQKTMNVEVEDTLVLAIGDPAAVEDLREHLEIEDYDVRDIVAMLMPELVRMSPQGTTHVKTLYSATNLIRRLPPGPIFAALTQLPGAIDTGSGFWSL